jgi:hypothetical protein
MSDTASLIKQAFSKYMFDFTLDGVPYHAWYDPDKNFICFDCGSDIEELLRAFLSQLRHLSTEYANMLGLDELDFEAFTLKHLKASIDVGKTLDEIE